ncbi:helix-turn-helix domain-containing protein [Nocardiopsis sediminis]|uniref:Helix-turn-helix domain-containing protein n=1 Tax=Nocardiopsis sediminis TaxID=1778267 RepID=A0ABV8FRR3_9ACTN
MQKVDRNKWRQFGRELRRLRELAGMTQRQLAGKVGLSHGMIGAIERSTRRPQADQSDAFDTVLETGGVPRRLWQQLAEQRHVPEWFRDVLVLELHASEIREYEPGVIPGLLQTPAYSRTLIKARCPTATPEEVEEMVRTRTARLPTILKGGRPLLWFIVKEGVFSRTVGDESIMREQLEHIAKLVTDGVIRIQVLPDSPASAEPGSSFRVMALGSAPPAVYVEHALGGEVIDKPEPVNALTTLFGMLQAEARPVLSSIDLIRRINGERYGNVD